MGVAKIKMAESSATMMINCSNSYVKISSCVTVSGKPVTTSTVPYYVPCTCKGQCNPVCCPCILEHGSAYGAEGLLKDSYISDDSSPPVIECSSFCSCEKTCVNRTSQREPLESIFISSAGAKGCGVFTSDDIPRGSFVCEYVGELVREKECEERLRDGGVCYVVKIREHLGCGPVLTTCIDAHYYGNISRFINHSCSPNLVIVPVRSNSILPRICLFTSISIKRREELCFSYCNTSSKKTDLGQVSCLCSSKNCRGFLPLQQ